MKSEEQILIDRYLHGELGDDEQESFEERFFADDDLFEQIEVAEMRLVDRYVRGEMDSSEAERFESGYLTTPERMAKVAKARVFHREIARMKPKSAGLFAKLGSLLEFRSPVLQYVTVAAVALLSIGLLWSVLIINKPLENVAETNINDNSRPFNTRPEEDVTPGVEASPGNAIVPDASRPTPDQQRKSSPGAVFFATITYPAGMRGRNVYSVIELEERTTVVELTVVLPDTAADDSYGVTITDESSALVWSGSSIKTVLKNNARALQLRVKAEILANGRYKLKIKPENSPGSIYNYGLEISRKGDNGPK